MGVLDFCRFRSLTRLITMLGVRCHRAFIRRMLGWGSISLFFVVIGTRWINKDIGSKLNYTNLVFNIQKGN